MSEPKLGSRLDSFWVGGARELKIRLQPERQRQLQVCNLIRQGWATSVDQGRSYLSLLGLLLNVLGHPCIDPSPSITLEDGDCPRGPMG